MLRTVLFIALAAAALALVTPSRAHAWGAYHAGYTHVGYGGVYHAGYTAVGGYGGYRGYGGYGGYTGYGWRGSTVGVAPGLSYSGYGFRAAPGLYVGSYGYGGAYSLGGTQPLYTPGVYRAW
jgi:hypothetical protein